MSSTSGESTEPFDPRAFRDALGTYATGVTIVTTVGTDGALVGLTCNSFSSVSLSPPLVLWSLSLRSANLSNFLQAPIFAINILAVEQAHIARRFAQSVANKFEGIAYHVGIAGVPLIEDAAAQLECRSERRYYSGDHVIFIGHVLQYACRDCVPLVFCRGCYIEPGSNREL